MLQQTALSGLAVAIAAAISLASPAHATLIGDFIDVEIDFDDPSHSDQVLTNIEVLSPESEATAGFTGPLRLIFGSVVVNVEDSEVTVDLFAGTEGPGTENPFLPALSVLLEDLQWVGMPGYVISAVTPDPGNDPGFSASFTNDSILIDYAGVPASSATTLMASATFDIAHVVPEPTTGLLLAIGLTAFGLRARRRGGAAD